MVLDIVIMYSSHWTPKPRTAFRFDTHLRVLEIPTKAVLVAADFCRDDVTSVKSATVHE